MNREASARCWIEGRMMKTYKTIVFVIISLLLLGQIFSGCGVEEKEASWYQAVVDDLIALQPYEVPEHLRQENCIKNGTEFDVNEYFNVMTNLSIEPGYVLDYVYKFEFLGGQPFLY